MRTDANRRFTAAIEICHALSDLAARRGSGLQPGRPRIAALTWRISSNGKVAAAHRPAPVQRQFR